MKKLLIILVVVLAGCGDETAVFNEPFIVYKISQEEQGCIYYGENQERHVRGGGWSPSPEIFTDCGLYQIGDTIKLERQ